MKISVARELEESLAMVCVGEGEAAVVEGDIDPREMSEDLVEFVQLMWKDRNDDVGGKLSGTLPDRKSAGVGQPRRPFSGECEETNAVHAAILDPMLEGRDGVACFDVDCAGRGEASRGGGGGIRRIAVVVGIGADALYENRLCNLGVIHRRGEVGTARRRFEIPLAGEVARVQRVVFFVGGNDVRMTIDEIG